MLPNVCFLLFPVVDYSRFRRTYYDAPAVEIYQKGLSWMLRGLLQLLLYRVIYQYFVPAPSGIVDLWTFAQFVLSSYLLYLHISGQFHLIVGILCLFGFNLPTTHHLYYLAPSFNSFWRRINIYWRDFMSKLVFYPAFAALAGRSMAARLVGATMTVFAGTWLLHSYQSFWLRGDFPLEWRDAVFWGVLGVLVVFNSLREVRTPAPTSSPEASPGRRAVRRSLATVATFSLICILWSLWSSSGIEEWLAYAAKIGNSSGSEVLLLLAILLSAVMLGAFAQLIPRWTGGDQTPDGVPWWDLAHSRPALYTTGTSLMLVALLGAQTMGWLARPLDEALASLRQNRLNVRDQELADRGYYEGVVDAGSFASALWKGHLQRPPGPEWAFIRDTDFVRFTDDVLEYELLAGYEGSWRDAPFRTNSNGFRDADHSVEKPSGTTRFALLGASYEMGAGVEDDEIFPAVLEEMLNRGAAPPVHPYEILNLSVGGYGLVQRAELLRREAFRYQPDLIVLTLYTTEENRLLNHLAYVVHEGIPAPPFLEDLLAQAGVAPGMGRSAARQALRPHADEVMRSALRQARRDSAAQGVPLIAVTVPTAQDLGNDPADVAAALGRLSRLAREVSVQVLDLGNVYAGHSGEEVRLAPWDGHANALGHKLLAAGFYGLLTSDSTLDQLRQSGTTHLGEEPTR